METKRIISTFGLLIFLVTQVSFAADRFWVATTNSNWNNTANWSTTSGGSSGATAPGASDIAIFDGGGLGNCAIDVNINVVGFNVVTGYTGTISQGSFIMSIGFSGASFSVGAFQGSTANITVKGDLSIGNTAVFTSTSGTLSLEGNYSLANGGTFNDNNGNVKFNGGFTRAISGSTTLNNLELSVNTNNINAIYEIGAATILTLNGDLLISGETKPIQINTGTINAKHNITVTNISTDTSAGGSATININGLNNQILTGSGVIAAGKLPNITIDKPSGTLVLSSDISMGKFTTWSFIQGNIDAITSNSNVVFTINNAITGSHTLHNVEFFSIGTPFLGLITFTITSGTELTVAGTLKLSGLPNSPMTIESGTINAQGDIIITNDGNGITM